jgi:hypothetical protein
MTLSIRAIATTSTASRGTPSMRPASTEAMYDVGFAIGFQSFCSAKSG